MCDGINRQALMTMMTTIHSAVQLCDSQKVPWIETNFKNELLWSDFKNMSVSDHLEYFLNPKWTEDNSFCMDDGLKAKPNEVYVEQGICFILNSEENIYSQRYIIHLPDD